MTFTLWMFFWGGASLTAIIMAWAIVKMASEPDHHDPDHRHEVRRIN